MEDRTVRVGFEIFGKVQGVYFRNHTKGEADRLGLRGYVMNTPTKTVKGVVVGPLPQVEEMKHWLSAVGSPKSRIDRAEFRNLKAEGASFSDFKVRR
mmetsp:Transcript_3904/g.8189  ORF Transcript_3904/g.8189 Transcript_3904/m.8189 type:complete len:97 (-) Transcript_3904:43-333(-)